VINEGIAASGTMASVVSDEEIESDFFKTTGEFVDFLNHLGGQDYEIVFRVASKHVHTIKKTA